MAETVRLFRADRQKSGSEKIVSYQCVVKPVSGIVGNRASLNENSRLTRIGRNIKLATNSNQARRKRSNLLIGLPFCGRHT